MPADMQLEQLLKAENINRRAVYHPGEVCRLLRISPTTLRQLCELAEQPARYAQLNSYGLMVVKPREYSKAVALVAAMKADADARKLIRYGKKERF